MALEIIKPGKDPKDPWVYFKCNKCECEFRVTMDETDQKYATADYNDYYLIYVRDCPHCGKSLYGSIEPKEE